MKLWRTSFRPAAPAGKLAPGEVIGEGGAVTEAEWLACADPQKMLNSLWRKASDRTLRLFACSCCRRVWRLLGDSRSKKAVKGAERFAEGETVTPLLVLASAAAWNADSPRHDAGFHASRAAEWAADDSPDLAAHEAAYAAVAATICDSNDAEDERYQATVLRDIFGNPFRLSSPLPPAVLAWNDRTIPRIAQAIYEDRHLPEGTLDTGGLAILADALLDAGCDDEVLLAHCRSEGPHVRGCWAVDVILGKE
jgi:hypothetical protein